MIQKNRLFYYVSFYMWVIVLAGCATVQGPAVDRREINAETRRLEIKSFEFNLGQIIKVNEIGYTLVNNMSYDGLDIESRPFLGLFVLQRHKNSNTYFGQKPKTGVYIAFVLPDTPIKRAGLKQGDIIEYIDDKPIETPEDVSNYVRKLVKNKKKSIGRQVKFLVNRRGEALEILAHVDEIPMNVDFAVIEEETVNALASTNKVFITQGLINFARNDDELAAIISHELGHIVKGHVKKKMAGIFINEIVATMVGATAEVFVPGSGNLVMEGAKGIGNLANFKYSRDLEREADYVSLQFLYSSGYNLETAGKFQERFAIQLPLTLTRSYLSSHPNSPERKLRLEKSVEQMK